MKKLPSPEQFRPKEKLYVIGKEVRAVSLQDALRKERKAVIIEVREIYSDDSMQGDTSADE